MANSSLDALAEEVKSMEHSVNQNNSRGISISVDTLVQYGLPIVVVFSVLYFLKPSLVLKKRKKEHRPPPPPPPPPNHRSSDKKELDYQKVFIYTIVGSLIIYGVMHYVKSRRENPMSVTSAASNIKPADNLI